VAGARRRQGWCPDARLVVLERLQQLLTGVHHEGAVGGDWLTDRQPTQDQGDHRSDRAAVAGVTLQTRPRRASIARLCRTDESSGALHKALGGAVALFLSGSFVAAPEGPAYHSTPRHNVASCLETLSLYSPLADWAALIVLAKLHPLYEDSNDRSPFGAGARAACGSISGPVCEASGGSTLATRTSSPRLAPCGHGCGCCLIRGYVGGSRASLSFSGGVGGGRVGGCRVMGAASGDGWVPRRGGAGVAGWAAGIGLAAGRHAGVTHRGWTNRRRCWRLSSAAAGLAAG